jgi:hypothetical protein
VVVGASPTKAVAEEARTAGLAWEHLSEPRPRLTLAIYAPSGQEHVFYLGPHAPHLTPKEIDLLHSIWLQLSDAVAPAELHHHDIVHLGLERLRRDLNGNEKEQLCRDVKEHLQEIGRSSRSLTIGRSPS